MSTTSGTVGVGVIGAGVISAQYLGNLTTFPDLEVRFVADIDLERAKARADEFGVPASGTVEQLLADDGIDIVVNLTLPSVHAEVDLAILAAGKHVWSEKPIATNAEDARRVLAAAEEAGLRVAVAPDTLLGAGLQTAFRAIADGRIGDPQTATTMVLNPGPDRWHPAPEFLFQAGGGPLLDLGPYYLSTLVTVFGSVVRVSAIGSIARPERVVESGPRAGTTFEVTVPTHSALLLEFEGGASAQATFSFQSAIPRPGFFEITGTTGAIVLPDPNMFEGDSELWTLASWKGVTGHDRPTPERIPAEGATQSRGLGVLELARAIRAGVPERASGALAAHVLDVMLAAAEASETHRAVEVASRVAAPAPLPADWNPTERTLA
ncbi:Gfo/Idh/MocA family protein [Amnibacterium setariae]|uniref:Gfo/Idh/MocA family oxidoreductase n=1 Tax=Amnibacterium setariae TaxID=2306585 RepID=A0A3A1U354_9MICO|nr:Gfo/Idh/MocA family oxidoreductase [Amnibacterium setariae]RIX30740.1 gfo/Idh/MocA family oxidoreductase [Amnibacterium setariae]